MSSEQTRGGEGPVVLAGYSLGVLAALGKYLPPRSVVCIDEPDVIRKRGAHAASAGQQVLGELVEWEYQREAAADQFYLAHRELRPSAVVPIMEYAVPFAGRLAERYGVAGAGYGAARILRDKYLLRQVTAAAGIPNPQSQPVTSPAEVRAFMASVGGPVVLKPANRQASVGTWILRDPAEADAAWAQCTVQDEGVFVPDRPLPLRMLAERFLPGEEFSVEMMFDHGRAAFGAVTKKFLFPGPRPVEQGHLHPADIGDELTRRLTDDTVRVLTAAGLGTGFVHCEWMVHEGVPYLIECNGRMAGDGIIELIEIAWGYDVVGQFYDLMRGRPLGAAPPARAPGYAAVWMAPAVAGVIESVDGAEEAAGLPGVRSHVVAHAGDTTHDLRSSWDRIAAVTAAGETAGEALTRAQQALARITVKIRPASG